MTHPDILIVGAGVAGLSLATALGGEGFRVTVIDGAKRPSAPTADRGIADWDLRVSALTPASIDFLRRLGAWSAIPGDRTGCYTGMKVWDGRGSGRIGFDASEVNAPYLGHIVENRLTLQALLQCAETCPGVEVRWECAMEDMTLTASGWEIHCEDGSTFCAPLTVGADGARSRVREWAGMPTRDWSYEQSAIVGTVTLASHHQDACWQAFLDTGPLALLPLAVLLGGAAGWFVASLERRAVAGDGGWSAPMSRASAPSPSLRLRPRPSGRRRLRPGLSWHRCHRHQPTHPSRSVCHSPFRYRRPPRRQTRRSGWRWQRRAQRAC